MAHNARDPPMSLATGARLERAGRAWLRVTAVGDCGVDRYLNLGQDRPGGITLNFAANARRLFAPEDQVGIVTALGTDAEAQLVRRALVACGLEACVETLEGATSIQYIDRQPSGEKIFVRFLAEYGTTRRVAESLARAPAARRKRFSAWVLSPGRARVSSRARGRSCSGRRRGP